MGLVGWTKMAVGEGRENGGGEKKKRGGRKERVPYVKDKGASLIRALCVPQGTKDDGTLPVGPGPLSKGAKTNGAL
jgi:hypothetical protein